MNKLLLLIMPTLLSGCATTPYVKVGVGYKLDATEIRWNDGHTGDSPYSARIQAGFKHGSFSYGVDHHSQWLTGAPFNDMQEYQKTELFLDYTYEFND